jgi:hypothetical protein
MACPSNRPWCSTTGSSKYTAVRNNPFWWRDKDFLRYTPSRGSPFATLIRLKSTLQFQKHKMKQTWDWLRAPAKHVWMGHQVEVAVLVIVLANLTLGWPFATLIRLNLTLQFRKNTMNQIWDLLRAPADKVWIGDQVEVAVVVTVQI